MRHTTTPPPGFERALTALVSSAIAEPREREGAISAAGVGGGGGGGGGAASTAEMGMAAGARVARDRTTPSVSP